MEERDDTAWEEGGWPGSGCNRRIQFNSYSLLHVFRQKQFFPFYPLCK